MVNFQKLSQEVRLATISSGMPCLLGFSKQLAFILCDWHTNTISDTIGRAVGSKGRIGQNEKIYKEKKMMKRTIGWLTAPYCWAGNTTGCLSFVRTNQHKLTSTWNVASILIRQAFDNLHACPSKGSPCCSKKMVTLNKEGLSQSHAWNKTKDEKWVG